MGRYRLGVLRGDGIGPEIVEAALEILEAAQNGVAALDIELMSLPVGLAAIQSHGAALPEETVEALRRLDGWIMGPHDSESYPPAELQKANPSGELRRRFDLYANIRPAVATPGVPATVPGMDLVVVRENTEDFYSDRNMYQGIGELMPTADIVLPVGKITRVASERIARQAFRLARQRRRHVTIVHKANVIRKAYGLFLEACHAVAAEFSDVEVDDYHVDAMVALLVRRGRDFDVVLTPNMFGDILSDLTAELAGSLGLAPSINSGDAHAMAQAAHGSAPDIAGKDIANPVGMILSTAMLMRWQCMMKSDPAAEQVAARMETAVRDALTAGVRTLDLGGSAATCDFTKAVVARLR